MAHGKVTPHGKEAIKAHGNDGFAVRANPLPCVFARHRVHGKAVGARRRSISARQSYLRTTKNSLSCKAHGKAAAHGKGPGNPIHALARPAAPQPYKHMLLSQLLPSTRAAASPCLPSRRRQRRRPSPHTRAAALPCFSRRAAASPCPPHARRSRLALPPASLRLVALPRPPPSGSLRRLVVPSRLAPPHPARRPAPPRRLPPSRPTPPQPCCRPSSRKHGSATGPTPPHRLALLLAGSGASRGLAPPMATGV
nr:vegetative cell wall protein gp1-like [Lolium perenne]